MKYLDLMPPTPAECLAADEALLDLCEEGTGAETLLFWEPKETFAVLGYANQAARELDLGACRVDKIPVFRRCSGGGTVLQGPGCLNYSVILRIPPSGPLQSISGTNSFIQQRNLEALQPLLKQPIGIQGHTDLAAGNLKFSGNAQRRKRNFLIFHGTFLLQFDIPLIGKYLRMPSKQPAYREDRPHGEFLMNLTLPADEVKAALRKIWKAGDVLTNIPVEKIAELVREKYLTDAWNFKT
jgi:lipoate-protein ligase A